MKANELMIDDWVYNKNIDKPMQVYPTMFSQMFRQKPDVTTYDYNIFPIPLTPEILEKNGFEKQGFDGWLLVKQMGNDLAWSILWRTDCSSPHLRIDSYSSQIGSFSSFAVSYVHQLQHALKLCGIEKEIEL